MVSTSSTPEPAVSPSPAADVSPRTERLLLVAVVALGLAVRFWGLKFGLPVVYARPDELLLIGVVIGFFRGDPNPHFFEYPTLYLYVLAGVYCLFYARSMLAGWVSGAGVVLVAVVIGVQRFAIAPLCGDRSDRHRVSTGRSSEC